MEHRSLPRSPLIVVLVVVAVLLCMLFMPGMVIFALAGAAAVVLLAPRLLGSGLVPVAVGASRAFAIPPSVVWSAGPAPPLLAPLRL